MGSTVIAVFACADWDADDWPVDGKNVRYNWQGKLQWNADTIPQFKGTLQSGWVDLPPPYFTKYWDVVDCKQITEDWRTYFKNAKIKKERADKEEAYRIAMLRRYNKNME